MFVAVKRAQVGIAGQGEQDGIGFGNRGAVGKLQQRKPLVDVFLLEFFRPGGAF